MANKIYYTNSATKLQTVTLPWKEKVVYGNVGEIGITVNNKVKGDLIINVDILSASLTDGKDGAMSVVGAWLKYAITVPKKAFTRCATFFHFFKKNSSVI